MSPTAATVAPLAIEYNKWGNEMSSEELKPKRKTRTSQAAVNRYNKKAYKQFAARIKPDIAERIERYTSKNAISKPEFLSRAIDALDK